MIRPLLRISLAAAACCLAACSSTPTGATLYPNSTPDTPAPFYPNTNFRPKTPAPNIRAASYILVDANTGSVLSSRGADVPRPVASTQKLVTALVVVKSGNLDQRLRVEPSDTRVEPTKLGLRPGEVLTRRELLTAFLVKSGNDGGLALARDNAGSIENFSRRMNSIARYCGAKNSYFSTPHGLSAPGQHSTARDMAKIAMAAYREPVIRDIVRRSSIQFHGHRLDNTNKLLTKWSDCNGMKTGYTTAAGRCLVSSASRWGKSVILVQLGTKTTYIWDDGRALMEWGLASM